MYKFDFQNKNGLILKSNKWRVSLYGDNGHIHVTINGPDRYRKSGLTSLKSPLDKFEMRVAALHFYKVAREHWSEGNATVAYDLKNVNYADIFGSTFD